MGLVKLAAIVLVIELFFIMAFFAGEDFACKFPGSKFSRWWRRHIAMQEEDDDI